MRPDKEKALRMRRNGQSYRQIRSLLNIPKSTLSTWFANEEWSKKVRERLARQSTEVSRVRIERLNMVRGEQLSRLYEEARVEARREFELRKYDPLFIAGVMLYWGEGTKSPRQGVKFTNSDPEMVAFYVQFLRRSCQIPIRLIRAYVLIYPDIEPKTAQAYWVKKIGLPWENFTKSVHIKGRHATRRLGWGVCTVSVSSTYFKQKMLEWIDLLPGELLGKAYYENMS